MVTFLLINLGRLSNRNKIKYGVVGMKFQSTAQSLIRTRNWIGFYYIYLAFRFCHIYCCLYNCYYYYCLTLNNNDHDNSGSNNKYDNFIIFTFTIKLVGLIQYSSTIRSTIVCLCIRLHDLIRVLERTLRFISITNI